MIELDQQKHKQKSTTTRRALKMVESLKTPPNKHKKTCLNSHS
jgi:hypothetical protein